MKTINLHLLQAKNQGSKYSNLKEKKNNSSADHKSLSTFQSEAKITKNNIGPKQNFISSPTAKMKQSTIDLRKPKRMTGNLHSITNKVLGQIGDVTSPSNRNASKSKNPDYFEVQKAKSPAHRNMMSTINMAKLLLSIKEKDTSKGTKSILLLSSSKKYE